MCRSTAILGFFAIVILMGVVRAADGNLAGGATQIVVCVAPETKSYEGTLQLFSRDEHFRWTDDSDRWPVLFAPRGLAWGRGLNPAQPGPQKRTADHHNPAGLFKLGAALGYSPQLPEGSHGWPYHQVTGMDAWIDDPSLPNFNHLYTLPAGAPEPAWWGREHMHIGDSAYEWMIVIEHNYDPSEPNAGNSIFFHIRRGEHYRTSGCTTMEKDKLIKIIKWLKPGSNAMLVELSRADYLRFWKSWQLPPPDEAL